MSNLYHKILSPLHCRYLIGVICGSGLIYICTIISIIVIHPSELDNWFQPKNRRTFSKVLWESTTFGDSMRYEMANDLIVSKMLLQKSEADVQNMLGSPTSLDRNGNETLIGYDLVEQKQFPAKCIVLPSFVFYNMDTWLLEIRCTNGIVIEVKIRFT